MQDCITSLSRDGAVSDGTVIELTDPIRSVRLWGIDCTPSWPRIRSVMVTYGQWNCRAMVAYGGRCAHYGCEPAKALMVWAGHSGMVERWSTCPSQWDKALAGRAVGNEASLRAGVRRSKARRCRARKGLVAAGPCGWLRQVLGLW